MKLVADVRTVMMKRKRKIQAVRGELGDAAQAGTSHPRPRDEIRLFLVPSLRPPGVENEQLVCRVEQVVQRAPMSPTARVGLVVITS